MFGLSYGELFLLVGATAALVGPKDLPMIARTAGRLAGRAIGYVQLARGQLDTVMQQSQARQVHKELQDTMSQLEAIRHEIRSISFVNPGPLTRTLMDNADKPPVPDPNSSGNIPSAKYEDKQKLSDQLPVVSHRMDLMHGSKDFTGPSSPINLQAQAAAYAKLAESEVVKSGSLERRTEDVNMSGDPFNILPISAESAGLLPDRKDGIGGSDIVLEAVLEAEVARNAKDFFSQPENQVQT